MLTPGDDAPDFELLGSEGDAIRQYRLSPALSSGAAVLAFYLFDFHPACTEQVCDIRDLKWFDIADDISVYGISTDSAFSHRAFASETSLDFPLLSDSDGSVATAYGVLEPELAGHRAIPQRSVFVVDDAQTVRYAWAADDPSQLPDWVAVQEAIDSLLSPRRP